MLSVSWQVAQDVIVTVNDVTIFNQMNKVMFYQILHSKLVFC
jgi:hypothetical protein